MSKMLFVDQINCVVELKNYPKRIVSIVPSQTELLHYLGLNDEVVGITKFCVHPVEWFKTKNRVGGTKKIDMARVVALQPDLIIANKEENLKEDVEALKQVAPVWTSDIKTLADALQMITNIGKIVKKEQEANSLVKNIQESFETLMPSTLKSCCYLIWQKPFMTIGADTFINDMFQYAGLQNVFASEERYPIVTIEDIQNAAPEIVLLSSEPFPFKQKHIDKLQQYLPNSKIILVDGEMFSWYGSRLLPAAQYFKELYSFIV